MPFQQLCAAIDFVLDDGFLCLMVEQFPGNGQKGDPGFRQDIDVPCFGTDRADKAGPDHPFFREEGSERHKSLPRGQEDAVILDRERDGLAEAEGPAGKTCEQGQEGGHALALEAGLEGIVLGQGEGLLGRVTVAPSLSQGLVGERH
jgi:hypothetical protein